MRQEVTKAPQKGAPSSFQVSINALEALSSTVSAHFNASKSDDAGGQSDDHGATALFS